MYWSCVNIVITILTTSLLSEGISYFLVYRTKKFKKLKNEIEDVSYQLKKYRELNKKQKTPKLKKAIEELEGKQKLLTRDLYVMQMPANFFLVLVFVSSYGFLNTLYDAYVVAQLPFVPFSLLQKVTHRGLPGDNYQECSMTFLLVIGSLSIRANVKKYLNFAPNVATNPFMPNMDDWDAYYDEQTNEDNNSNDNNNTKKSK